MLRDPGWRARLAAGPLDGATLSLDIAQADLPDEVVVCFAVDEPAGRSWHNYVLEPSRTAFRYLGEESMDEPDGEPDGEHGGEHGVAGPTLTARCYEVLFERHPQLRSMFPADIGPQTVMLQATLDAVLGHLDDPDWLWTTLRSLGREHAHLGVTQDMYTAFIEAMLTAMADLGGEEWTPLAERGWRETLEDITALMASAGRPG